VVTRGWTRRSGLAVAGAATVVACGPQPGAQPSESRPAATARAASVATDRHFKIGVSFEVLNVSPHDNGFWLTSYGSGQSLLRVSPEEKLEPWIAQSITADGAEGYTIKLNPAARFHNGKPIDARQVRTAIQRHLEAGVRSIPSLKGAAWESPDAQTLRIRTVEPDPWLPNYLALAYLPIFDTDEVPEPGKLNADALNALVGKGFYSGPFKVTRLTPQEMSLDAVPNAWDGASSLAGVDVKGGAPHAPGEGSLGGGDPARLRAPLTRGLGAEPPRKKPSLFTGCARDARAPKRN
jgi:peptide/nickel transport system substrate-binding protein